MHPPSRPPNRSDGSTAVTAREESGGDPPPVGAAGASAQTSRSNDSGERGRPGCTGGGEPGSPPRCRPKAISPVDSLGVFQKRSIFIFPRRSSSGYFSFDGESLPSSPLSPRAVTADRATQTPSLTGQVMIHAFQRMAETHGGGPGTQHLHESPPSPSSRRQQNAGRDMQVDTQRIGQELQVIGDDLNSLVLRRMAGRQRRVGIHPFQLPHIYQEPSVLLCMGLALFVIARIIYLYGSTNSRDNSQV